MLSKQPQPSETYYLLGVARQRGASKCQPPLKWIFERATRQVKSKFVSIKLKHFENICAFFFFFSFRTPFALIECGQSGARILLFNVNYRRIGQFNNLSGFVGWRERERKGGSRGWQKSFASMRSGESERENNWNCDTLIAIFSGENSLWIIKKLLHHFEC